MISWLCSLLQTNTSLSLTSQKVLVTHPTVEEIAAKFYKYLETIGFTKDDIITMKMSKDSAIYKHFFKLYEDSSNAEHKPIAPDADGNCQDGWELKDLDGIPMCVMPEDTTPETDAITEPTPESMLRNLVTKKHSLKHKFAWPVPLMLAPGEEKEFMLFKGVAMQSGEMKRGEKMDKDNLIFATGAMSTAAMMGVALMDIDHFETAAEIPQSYLEKYGKDLINPYPPAFIIDAAVEINKTEPGGKEYAQVEFIGACTNPLVYDMILKAKFKGCSVVDYYRKETCDCGTDQKEGDVCNKCTIEGSHFLMNTFILEEVPNSNGTWVQALGPEDVGTIIERPSEELIAQLKLKLNKDPRMRMKTILLGQNKKLHAQYELDNYMNTETGVWNDGKTSIVAFLVDEKSIPETTASDMADYLFAHPEALNQYQYENMSAEDLVAWFRHITEMAQNAKLLQHSKQLAALSLIKHNADGLKVLKDIDQLGKDEVNYGPGAEGSMCQECRWFFALDPSDMAGPGVCAIVSGDILGTDTCDRFEASPGGGGTAEPDQEPADESGNDPNAEHPDPVEPNEDGTCNEGWKLNEETGMCEKIMENQEEPIEPDADGNCPDGWVLGEVDGTPMCMIPEGVPNKLRLIKNGRLFKLFRKHTNPTVKIEAKPKVKVSIVKKQYLERRDKIIKEINKIGMVIGVGRDSMEKMGRLAKLRKDLHDLDHILKKT